MRKRQTKPNAVERYSSTSVDPNVHFGACQLRRFWEVSWLTASRGHQRVYVRSTDCMYMIQHIKR